MDQERTAMLHLGRLTLAFMAMVVMLLLVGTTRADSAKKKLTSRQERAVARPSALKSWSQRSQSYFTRQKDFLEYIRGDRSPTYGERQATGG